MRFALALILVLPALSGCLFIKEKPADGYADRGFKGDPSGAIVSRWPDMTGHTVRVLDNGVLAAMQPQVGSLFENLTGAKLVIVDGPDSGAAADKVFDGLNARGKKIAPADVLFGIDLPRLPALEAAGAFEAYKPKNAGKNGERIIGIAHGAEADDPIGGPLLSGNATPVDHAYVGLVVDRRSPALENVSRPALPFPVLNYDSLKQFPDQLVVANPATSGRGLALMLATVAHFGEGGPQDYTWTRYWADLFAGYDRDHNHVSDGPVTVTASWREAYNHFTARPGGGDKPVALGLTTLPALEYAADLGNASHPRFGGHEDDSPVVMTAAGTTYHHVEFVAILTNLQDRGAAQAFVEFTLTDAFQDLLLSNLGLLPVTKHLDNELCETLTVDTCDLIPRPNVDFTPAGLDPAYVTANLDRWVCEWTAIQENNADDFLACSEPPEPKKR